MSSNGACKSPFVLGGEPRCRDAMEDAVSYCPYCNNTDRIDLTDEHVIPKSIGGDSRTLIRVCRRCNSTIGHSVDKMLSGNEWMRMNGLFAGGIGKRLDQLESLTTLKDGQRLEGYFFFIRTDNGVVPGFEPKKHQSDGTVWLSEDAISDCDALPRDINVFRRDMVEYWGYNFPPARKSGIESAMVKVLLGIIYMDQGRAVVSSSSFDILRSSLSGSLHPKLTYTWLDKPMTWGESTIQNHEHAVYFECVDEQLFRAGVALFGTGITFEVLGFGCVLPRRCFRWFGRPGWLGAMLTQA